MARIVKKSIELSEPILVRNFSLTRVFENTKELKNILDVQGELLYNELDLLNQVRTDLSQNADSWNEEELKMQFISIVMLLSRFQTPIRSYYDREISETINGTFVKCKADMLLAQGMADLIETPYFFLHEYKREKKYSGDPIGQMLAGMLIAQAKNNNDKPNYGCYVQGRFWFFSVLLGKEYVVSHSFDATNEAVATHIILILRKLKHIILTELIENK